MRNEAPENSLGDREGQGDEDYSQKTGQALFNFPEIQSCSRFGIAAPTSSRTGAVAYAEPCLPAGDEQTREKTESGEDFKSQTRASAAIYARDAFNVGSS